MYCENKYWSSLSFSLFTIYICIDICTLDDFIGDKEQKKYSNKDDASYFLETQHKILKCRFSRPVYKFAYNLINEKVVSLVI